VKNMGGTGKSNHLKKVQRMTLYILSGTLGVFVIILCFILFAVLSASTNRHAYLPLYHMFRFSEIFVCIVLLLSISKHLNKESFLCKYTSAEVMRTKSESGGSTKSDRMESSEYNPQSNTEKSKVEKTEESNTVEIELSSPQETQDKEIESTN